MFAYAGGFSYAYIQLSTATGALLLFGEVQFSMIGIGLVNGERFTKFQIIGLMIALAGLLILFFAWLNQAAVITFTINDRIRHCLGRVLCAWQVCGISTARHSRKFHSNDTYHADIKFDFFLKNTIGCDRGGLFDFARCICIGSGLCDLVFGIANAQINHCLNRSAQCAGDRGWVE